MAKNEDKNSLNQQKIFPYSYLAALQLGAIISIVLIIIGTVILYHFFSEDALVELFPYIVSFKIAIPPLLAFISIYVITILFGTSPSDATKLMIRWLRNVYFQNNSMLIFTIILSFIFFGIVLIYTNTQTPSVYNNIVAKLLGGENDNMLVIKKSIQNLKEKNKLLSERLELVAYVFDERRMINTENYTFKPTLLKAYLRELTTNYNTDRDWEHHPLRLHATAEVYSMLAENLFTNSSEGKIDQHIKTYADNAIDFYTQVYSSHDPRATELLKASALNNIGNVYLYMSEFKKATESYNKLLNQHKSLATYGNIVVAYILDKDYPNAENTGELAIKWASDNNLIVKESGNYVNLLTNIGFLNLYQSKFIEAESYFKTAFEIQKDDNTRINYIISLICSDKIQEANNMSIGGSSDCMNFVRAISIISLKDKTRDADAISLLANYAHDKPLPSNSNNLNYWIDIAIEKATKDKIRCGSFLAIPKIATILGRDSGQQ